MEKIKNNCGYVRAYGHACEKIKPCREHGEKKCRCGREAVKECETAGSMTCGEPLCESGNDCNGRGGHPHY